QLTHQSGIWEFFPEFKSVTGFKVPFTDKKPFENLGWLIRRPSFVIGGAYVGLVVTSFVTNGGGLMASLAGPSVTKHAWGNNDVAIARQVEEARAVAEPQIAEVGEIISGFQEQAQAVYLESIGRGTKTNRYGFGPESKGLLDGLNADYNLAAVKITQLGYCSGLEELENVYGGYYDLFDAQYEQTTDPKLGSALYGRFYSDTGFDKKAIALDSVIRTCEQANPESIADLADSITEKMKSVRERVESAEVQDPTELNPDIHEINRDLQRLAKQAGFEPEILEEMDPPSFEGFKMILESWHSLFTGGNTSVYPMFLSVVGGVIDELGLLISLIILLARRKREEGQEAYLEYLKKKL
ncbi:MAG: hypothetical protein ABIG43_04205, partial [Chloroflexota bacterium]